MRAPAEAIPSCFGPQSACAHRKLAEEHQVSYCEIALPSLAIDLDRPEDIDDFLKQSSGGKETRDLFKTLGWRRGKPA